MPAIDRTVGGREEDEGEEEENAGLKNIRSERENGVKDVILLRRWRLWNLLFSPRPPKERRHHRT